MNNLQIAIGRITRGIGWLKAFLIQRIQQILGKKPEEPDKDMVDDGKPKTEEMEMNHLDACLTLKVADGISDGPVQSQPSGFMVDGELNLKVPIAEGESDYDNLSDNVDDEDDEDDGEQDDDEEDNELPKSALRRDDEQNTVKKKKWRSVSQEIS